MAIKMKRIAYAGMFGPMFAWRKCCVAVGCLVMIAAGAASDELRWRTSDNKGVLLLFTADTDLGTDFTGPLQFSCKRGEGLIEVEGELDEIGRKAVADLIRSDEYPAIGLVPDGKTFSLLQISFSEMRGWLYAFSVAPDEPPFEEFKRTGTFHFKIGSTVIEETFKTGLESVAMFQGACRKSPPK
jgi:hypothetical protein